MSRPQIIVNVTGALPRRGTQTETGTAFLAFAGAAGPTDPVVCQSAADATAAAVPDAIAAYVGDALEQGAPEVVIVRATAVDPAAVTEPEWTAALAKFTNEYGAGQVLIPGVTTAAAYSALLDHADAFKYRVALLDTPDALAVATAVTAAGGLTASDGAKRAAMFGAWPTLPGAGGTTRDVPGSVIAAGLAARGDSSMGHANQAPIFDQGRDAGLVKRATTVSTVVTDAEADTLYDAGVNLFRVINGNVTLTGWRALTDDPIFRQFNIGRLAMQLVAGLTALMFKFLGRQIDGKGQLFSEIEGAIRGYLLGIYTGGGLYGGTADEAFDAQCDKDNNPTSGIASGQVKAAVTISATAHTEQITIDVVTAIAEGVAA